MTTFVDTSALYALLSAGDADHGMATEALAAFEQQQEKLVTTNYVIVEIISLLGRRLGLAAVRDFQTRFVPLLHVHWVDQALHARSVAALLTANSRSLSLVDCVSFETMRQLGLDSVFAIDAHFAQQGFHCIP